MASPQFGATAATGVAGCGAVVVGIVFLVIFGGVAFMILAGGSIASRQASLAATEAEQEAQRENAKRTWALAAQLEDSDTQKSLSAWHAIAACDAADHAGTFTILDKLFARTRARNALWNVSCGFQMFYDRQGQDAISRELVARKGSEEEVDLLCQSLEQYPDSVQRDFGEAKGSEVRMRALRALEKAEAMTDHPAARMRIGLALERVRAKMPAERR